MLKLFRRKLISSNNKFRTSLDFKNRLSEKLEQIKMQEKSKLWLRKYEDVFGITKLKEMHERVLKSQKEIQNVQEKRRNVQEQLFITQKKLQDSRDVLHKTPMGDNNYITIVTQVHELLKEQKNLQETFAWYDQTEKEQQTTLALAINNSQDHERTYREKNKYLSLLTGVIGGLLGLVGSSINNWRYRKEIQFSQSNLSEKVINIQKKVEKLNSSKDNPKDEEDFWLQIKQQQQLFHDNVSDLQSLVSNIARTDFVDNKEFYLDLQLKNMAIQLEKDLKSKLNYYTSINISVISSLLLFGSILLYMTNTR